MNPTPRPGDSGKGIMKRKFPNDSTRNVRLRMRAVANGFTPNMPGLSTMTGDEMRKAIQSIWTVLDETGVARTNEGYQMGLYGRVLAAIRRGSLVADEMEPDRKLKRKAK